MATNDFRCTLFVSKYDINVQTHDSSCPEADKHISDALTRRENHHAFQVEVTSWISNDTPARCGTSSAP